jgi:hypothetical protein
MGRPDDSIEMGKGSVVHFKILPRPQPDGKRFELIDRIDYYSKRYKKWVRIDPGYRSDGATGVVDIMSMSWWVHDKVCETKVWADGTPVSAWESSMILYDILKQEGYIWRAPVWALATYLVQRRKKGWRKD